MRAIAWVIIAVLIIIVIIIIAAVIVYGSSTTAGTTTTAGTSGLPMPTPPTPPVSTTTPTTPATGSVPVTPIGQTTPTTGTNPTSTTGGNQSAGSPSVRTCSYKFVLGKYPSGGSPREGNAILYGSPDMAKQKQKCDAAIDCIAYDYMGYTWTSVDSSPSTMTTVPWWTAEPQGTYIKDIGSCK